MNIVVKQLQKNTFVKNVIAIASGTTIAQIITILFTPIITRVYGPEALGTLGVFTSLINIISPLAALCYPVAIVLPKYDEDARGLVHVSVFISISMAVFSLILLGLFEQPIIKTLNIGDIERFLYLIPLIIVFSTILQIVQQWLIRLKDFRVLGKSAVIHSFFINASKVCFGLISPISSVLIAIATFGNAIYALILYIGSKKLKTKIVSSVLNIKYIWVIMKKYRDFPLYRTPQILLNSISLSMPILLLSSFFGPAAAGFYTISKSLLGVPTQLIGKAVGDVFYPSFSNAVNNNEKFTEKLLKVTLGLALIGVLPFGIVVVYGPFIFEFILGTQWKIAGEYARWLALWSFFSFINRPSVNAIPVLKLQAQFLIYEILSLVIRFLALFLCFKMSKSDIYSITTFSVISAILNFVLIIYTIFKSKKIQMNK